MPHVSKLSRLFRRPTHPVQSLSVQAQATSHTEPPNAFTVLVLHLLSNFVATDPAAQSTTTLTRLLQAIVLLGLPPVLLTLLLIGSYSGLMPFGSVRAYPLQAQDHFLYVTYAFATAGLAALLRWPAFFPSLLDVRVLSLLPISAPRLFAARIMAAALFLSAFVIGANLPGALLLVAIAGSPFPMRHLTAHLVATGMAAPFAITACISLLSLCEAALGSRLRNALTPLVQSALIASLVVLLMGAVAFAWKASPDMQFSPTAALVLPSLPFSAVYQVLQANSPAAVLYRPLSHVAAFATLCSTGLAFCLYPVAYRRRQARLIAGQDHRRVSPSPLRRLLARGAHLLVRAPQQRAAFSFVHATATRVPQFRTSFVVALGTGLGGTASLLSLFSNGPNWPASYRACVVALAFVGGASLTLGTAYEIAASWLFHSTLAAPTADFLTGVRRWVFGCTSIVSSAVLLASYSHAQPSAATLVADILTTLTWVLLVEQIFFVPFAVFPFTISRMMQRSSAIVLLLTFTAGCPLFIILLPYLTQACQAHSSLLVVGCFAVLTLRITERTWSPKLLLQLWLLSGDETVQRLRL